MPLQYTVMFTTVKIDNFQLKHCNVFLIFAQHINCGYSEEPPHQSVSTYKRPLLWMLVHAHLKRKPFEKEKCNDLRRTVRKNITIWLLFPVKTQISMGIHVV